MLTLPGTDDAVVGGVLQFLHGAKMTNGYRLTAATGIHKGDRDYQQDRVALLNHPRVNGCVMGIVADGMGGAASGELASSMAGTLVLEALKRTWKSADPSPATFAEALRDATQTLRERRWYGAQLGLARVTREMSAT